MHAILFKPVKLLYVQRVDLTGDTERPWLIYKSKRNCYIVLKAPLQGSSESLKYTCMPLFSSLTGKHKASQQ